MELLERYLQAVGEYLPAKMKADILAELRADLLAQIEAREEELGRPLTEAEVSAIIMEHGRPVLVAIRYMPQHSLIGPGLFPFYWYTLWKSFPFVILAYVAAHAATFLFREPGSVGVGPALAHLPNVLFIFWGVVTLFFAVAEYAQGRCFKEVKWSKEWKPGDLPAVEKPDKQSRASRVADLVVAVVMIAWVLAIPHHPYLLLGPGLGYLRGMPVGLTPEWHLLYWQIVGLLLAMLPFKGAALFRSMRRWRRALDVAAQFIGVLVLGVLVQARTYFVPLATPEGMSRMSTILTLNNAINLGFKIALIISVLKLLWDVWQMLATSHAERTGYVAAK
jgi:hypothetical protein